MRVRVTGGVAPDPPDSLRPRVVVRSPVRPGLEQAARLGVPEVDDPGALVVSWPAGDGLLRAARRGLLPGSGGGGVVGLRNPGVVVAEVGDAGVAPAAQRIPVVPVVLLRPGLVHEAVGIGVVRGVVLVADLRLPVGHVRYFILTNSFSKKDDRGFVAKLGPIQATRRSGTFRANSHTQTNQTLEVPHSPGACL